MRGEEDRRRMSRREERDKERRREGWRKERDEKKKRGIDKREAE